MDLIQQYSSSEDEDNQLEFCLAVGGNALESMLTSHLLLKNIDLVKNRRSVKKTYVEPCVDAPHEPFAYKINRGNAVIQAHRNRFSDRYVLTEEGKEKQDLINTGQRTDIVAVYWLLYCPGHGRCRRQCGGIEQCTDDCNVERKRHDHHNCQVKVTAKIMLSDETKWKVIISGSHNDQNNQMPHDGPDGHRRILESVKDNIMVNRSYGIKPYEVFRRQIKDIQETEMEDAFKDTRQNPTDKRVNDFIKNTEKRHSFASGQWTALHNLAVHELKETGILLFYQRDNNEAENQDIDHGFLLAVSNQTALKSARVNQHMVGIDGKHGLQDDGAALMTAITQHRDGFGCPVSFTIMSRENSQNIFLALRSIVENVPCENEDCDHPYRYFSLPGNRGFRRVTGCSRVNPYNPVIMIDKFEASANACTELGLQYVLCWFHIVKALMEKFNNESVSLLNAYLIILAFKIVARSVSGEEAEQRWVLFLEVISTIDMDTSSKERLKSYFINEWWCWKWRNAWLDVTRLPLITDGSRTMTTNNCDENLNLKVANSVGGKRKKVTTLLYELTGKKAARLGNEETKRVEKASLLDTHAAKTICHNLGTKSSTPADILLHQNQARFLFLQGKVKATGLANVYLVDEDEKRIHKFKDHKGNWITVSETKVLDKMLSSLLPEGLSVNVNDVVINVEKGTCTCTDYIWRSSLRDKCVHMQAVDIYRNCQRGDHEDIREECREELANFLRRKQLARPRQHRDLLLYDKNTNVVLDRLEQLYDEHGGKLWSILTTASKSQKSDRYRPKDLPKNNHSTGRPKERTAKPRAANPFKRKRIIKKRNEDKGVEIMKSPSLKKNRNTARRAANRIVAKAKQIASIASSLKSSASSSLVKKISLSDPEKDSPVSDFARLRRKRLEMEKESRQTTSYFVKELIANSPSMTRGKIMLKLARRKSGCYLKSSSGRPLKRKSFGPDFSYL